MTDTLRTLLATPGIHRQIGCSESTVSRWRTDPDRRPVASFVAPLIAIAPTLESEIRAWCLPSPPPPKRRKAKTGPMKVYAFRLPERVIDGADAILDPGEDRSALVREGITREVARRRRELARREREAERRDEIETRIDTRHHADDCRTEGTAVDFGCPRCAAKVGLSG